jgi:hypothetical protein
MESLHDRETVHAMQTKLLMTLRATYWWKGQLADVQSWVNTCKICQVVKLKPQHAKLQPYATPLAMSLIQTDIVGPYAESPSGAKYVAIFVDHATLCCELAAIKNCDAVTVATIFVDQWCSRYGFPRQLITDLDPATLTNL